jgi:hypothetical protein
MKIPTHWPNGTPMKVEHRIHFMSFICGVVYCETCGDIVAKCGCGKEEMANLVPSCPSCKPEEHVSPHRR